MPFTNYTIDPTQLEAMKTAFRKVCGMLQIEGGVENPITEVIIMKIVALSTAGVRDPDELCGHVLLELESQKRLPS